MLIVVVLCSLLFVGGLMMSVVCSLLFVVVCCLLFGVGRCFCFFSLFVGSCLLCVASYALFIGCCGLFVDRSLSVVLCRRCLFLVGPLLYFS